MTFKQFMISPLGLACILIFRFLVADLLICLGVKFFDFKRLDPFFTWKRFVSLFLLMVGARLLIDAIFCFQIS